MKKNYIKRNENSIVKQKIRAPFQLTVWMFLSFLCSHSIIAQVNITTPNLDIPVCSGFPSTYNTLNDIVIAETANGNFSTGVGRTLILTCPTNFEFLPATGSIAVTGGRNLSATSIAVTTTTITVTYTCGGTNRLDTMTISGIQVRAINFASTGDITRTGGTGVINGLINGTALTNTITSTAASYATISMQPTSASTCTNGTQTFSVTASNVITFQWQRNGVDIVDAGIYSGATTSTLTITNPTIAENGASYTVILNGATCPTTSSAAIITVNSLPANPANPTSNSPQCSTPGVTITKSGSPSGGITWYWETLALGTATTSNANASSIVSTSGTYYIRAQNNTTGCWSLGSGSIAVVVNTIPVISIQPTSSAACTNETITFSVTASGVTTYQWKKNGVNITNTGIYSGVTTGILTITNPTIAENGASYTVVLNNATCPVTSNAAVITVNSLPANPANPSSNSPQCSTPGVTITKSGNPPGGVSWYWQTSTLGTDTSFNANTPYLATTSGTYYIRAQNNTTGCWSLGSGSIVVTVNAIPVISTQPQANSTCTNGTITFNVTASGVTSYQWKKNGVNLTNTGIYSGVTTATLTITNPSIVENGASYTVVLNNATCPITSNSAIITVNALPSAPTAITPNGAISICNGYSTNLNATSAGNTINWYTVASGGTTIGSSLSAASFSVSPTTATTYYAESQSPFGCISATRSATAVISVTSINPVIEFTQGANDHTYTTSASSCGTIIGGGQNDLDIFSGDPAGTSTYQWQVSLDNGNSWGNGPGPTSTTTQFVLDPLYTNYESVAGTYYFRLLITNAGCTGISNAIILTVTGTSTLIAGVVGSNQVFCTATGNPVAFTATTPTGGTGIYAYQWQSSTDNINFTNISGATAATYDSPVISQTTYFRRFVTSSGCQAISNTITVFIGSPTITLATSATSICFSSGIQTTSLAYTATTGSPVTYSIVWNASPANSFLTITNAAMPASSPFTISIPANTAAGTYTGTLSVKNSSGCNSAGSTFTVTVNPIPSTPTIIAGGPLTFCSGGSVTLTASVGTSYLWSTGASTSNINVSTSGSYTVKVYNAFGCQSASSIATIVTVNGIPATPTISAAGPTTFCSGGSVTLTSSAGSSYLWSTGDTSASIAVTTSGNYTVKVGNASGCQSASSSITSVAVNSVSAPSISGNQTLECEDLDADPFTVTTAATGSGTLSYQWQSNTVGCGGTWADLTGATSPTYSATSITQTTYYHVVVNSTLNSVACPSASNCITVISHLKTWNGSVDANWNTNGNWTPSGVPTTSDCVIIPNVSLAPIVSGGTTASAYSLTILNGGVLTVNSNNNLVITDAVSVNAGAQLYLKDSASLVQTNTTSNTGNVNIERITQPMYRFDYTYWGCPVTLASGFTLGMLSPNTLSDKYFIWTPTVAGSFGNWNYETAATIMDPTKGYIVRAPQTFSYTSAVKVPYTANFIGIPNNGDILCPIFHGSLALTTNNDKYNLIGNPYPCAIDAEKFLSNPTNSSVIDGTIYFWTHNSPPSTSNVDPFYGDYVINYSPNDYASWNKLGGTGTTSAASSGGSTPSGYIASGQGFFAKSNGTAASGNTVVFNNSMRVTDNNKLFFRSSSANQTATRSEATPIEKHRLWLNLINNGGNFNQILVGYVEGATSGWDRDFDGVRFTDNNGITLYSIIPDYNLVIQGRPLPFAADDQVPLGFKSTTQDIFSLRIDHFDGLFENQNIYLEDRLLNVIHDLKQSPYTFTSQIGTFNDRFVLRYNLPLLSTYNPESDTNLVAFITNQKMIVQCSARINQVFLYDLSGKLVLNTTLSQPADHFETNFAGADGVYIAKFILENEAVVTRKLIKQK